MPLKRSFSLVKRDLCAGALSICSSLFRCGRQCSKVIFNLDRIWMKTRVDTVVLHSSS